MTQVLQFLSPAEVMPKTATCAASQSWSMAWKEALLGLSLSNLMRRAHFGPDRVGLATLLLVKNGVA
jgi:hypothetical protein